MKKYILLKIFLLVGLVIFLGGYNHTQAQITPRPNYDDFSIDIIWGAETYTPPGFKGKSLPIRGSSIIVTALAPTQNIKNIEFSWIIRDISAPFSGIAKKKIGDNTFSFTAEGLIPGFTHEIEVIAKNINTGDLAKAGVDISLVRPEAYLYNVNTGSLLRKTINTFPGDIVETIVHPFYFNSPSLDNLSFSWIFAGREYKDDSQPNSFTFNISRETIVGTEKSLKIKVEDKNSFRENTQITSRILVRPR